MRNIVVSTLVTDRITLADGSSAGEYPGGAGLYALCGLRVWADDVLLVTGVGEDYTNGPSAWFQQNGISTGGLLVRDEHSPVSLVNYAADGERVETPLHGLAHYQRLEAMPWDVAPFCADAKAVYVFKDFGPPSYWDEMAALRQKHGFALLWELNADIAVPERLEKVRATAKNSADVLSLNRTEAMRLLGLDSAEACAEALRGWGLPAVYLRCGGDGALYVTPEEILPIPAVTTGAVVDVTGGGNASSAAVLYGYSTGRPARVCGLMGSIAAAFCIAQYGPPPLGAQTRATAEEMLRELCAKGE